MPRRVARARKVTVYGLREDGVPMTLCMHGDGYRWRPSRTASGSATFGSAWQARREAVKHKGVEPGSIDTAWEWADA